MEKADNVSGREVSRCGGGLDEHVPEAGCAGVLIEPLDAGSSTPSAVELVENRRVDVLPALCAAPKPRHSRSGRTPTRC